MSASSVSQGCPCIRAVAGDRLRQRGGSASETHGTSAISSEDPRSAGPPSAAQAPRTNRDHQHVLPLRRGGCGVREEEDKRGSADNAGKRHREGASWRDMLKRAWIGLDIVGLLQCCIKMNKHACTTTTGTKVARVLVISSLLQSILVVTKLLEKKSPGAPKGQARCVHCTRAHGPSTPLAKLRVDRRCPRRCRPRTAVGGKLGIRPAVR